MYMNERKTIVIVQFSWLIFYLLVSGLMLDERASTSRVTCDYRSKSFSSIFDIN